MKSSFSDLITGPVPVLVDFWAEWCGPCRQMAPVLEQVKKEMGERLRIIKIDVDKNEALSARYQIRSIPTMILFKNGKEVWRQSGAVPASWLSGRLQETV